MLPTSSSLWMTRRTGDSFFVIHDPDSGSAQVFRQLVLPFGSKASVTAFIRAAYSLWLIGLRCLGVVWSFYFDDFLNVCAANEARHLDIVVSAMFKVLGWKVSEDKLVPCSSCCKVLGIELDLSSAAKGWAVMKNTDCRRSELVECLEAILKRGHISRSEVDKVRGRLQFASGQLFGRLSRHAVHSFSSRRASCHGLGERVEWAVRDLCKVLRYGKPREISRRLQPYGLCGCCV